MNVCLIPARGGSKRIPNKNLEEINGEKMLFRAYDMAKKSGLFHHVIISTDSDETIRLARSRRCNVIRRPSELCDDHSPVICSLHHYLSFVAGQDVEIDSICLLYSTAVFTTPSDLINAKALLTDDVYSVMSAIDVSKTWRAINPTKGEYIFPQYCLTRSQDLPELLLDAGQFVFFHSPTEKYFDKTSKFFLMDRTVIDIDYPRDLIDARKLLR